MKEKKTPHFQLALNWWVHHIFLNRMEASLYVEMQYFSLITFGVNSSSSSADRRLHGSVEKFMPGSEPKAAGMVGIPKHLYVCYSPFSNKILQRIWQSFPPAPKAKINASLQAGGNTGGISAAIGNNLPHSLYFWHKHAANILFLHMVVSSYMQRGISCGFFIKQTGFSI